jgi:hypothetical protein
VEEIPEDIRSQIDFVYADTIDDVLNYIFGVRKAKAAEKAKADSPRPTRRNAAKKLAKRATSKRRR